VDEDAYDCDWFSCHVVRLCVGVYISALEFEVGVHRRILIYNSVLSFVASFFHSVRYL
jgi:hypothetical protein